MTEDEFLEDVRYWKGRADAAEAEMCEARELGGKYLNEIVAQKRLADEREENWRQAWRDLRELSISSDFEAVKRRIFDVILDGPSSPLPSQHLSGEK